MGEKSRNFKVYLGDGQTPEVFTVVAALKETSYDIENPEVDISTKDSDGWRELMPDGSLKKMDVAGSGYINQASRTLLTGKVTGGSIDNYEVRYDDGSKYAGQYQMTKLSGSGGSEGAEEFNIEMKSSKEITYTAGP